MLFGLLFFAILAYFIYVFFKLDADPLLAFYEKFFKRSSLEKLKNKTVWLVGASTGLGEELALQLAELNCRLILTSTTKSKLDTVKENCLKRSTNLKSDDVLVLAYDIADLKENERAFKEIIDKFGDIDVLINNAARATFNRINEDMNLELAKKIFDINYFGNIHIAKLVTKFWLETKSNGLKIISPTSAIAVYNDMMPFCSTYVSSKKALNNFYRDLSLQHHKDGISVCITTPGPTVSALSDNAINQKGNVELSIESVKKMTTQRCCELMLISIGAKLYETWICEQPWLFFTYICSSFGYYLFITLRFFNLINRFENQFLKK